MARMANQARSGSLAQLASFALQNTFHLLYTKGYPLAPHLLSTQTYKHTPIRLDRAKSREHPNYSEENEGIYTTPARNPVAANRVRSLSPWPLYPAVDILMIAVQRSYQRTNFSDTDFSMMVPVQRSAWSRSFYFVCCIILRLGAGETALVLGLPSTTTFTLLSPGLFQPEPPFWHPFLPASGVLTQWDRQSGRIFVLSHSHCGQVNHALHWCKALGS